MVYGPRGDGRAAAPVRDTWRAHVDGHAAWRGLVRPPHRLCQSRQSHARARDGPHAASSESAPRSAPRAGTCRVSLLLESLILSLAGAALGAAVAWWGVDALRSAIPAEVPRAATIAVDLRVLAATGIVAMSDGHRVRHRTRAAVFITTRCRRTHPGGTHEHGRNAHQARFAQRSSSRRWRWPSSFSSDRGSSWPASLD